MADKTARLQKNITSARAKLQKAEAAQKKKPSEATDYALFNAKIALGNAEWALEKYNIDKAHGM